MSAEIPRSDPGVKRAFLVLGPESSGTRLLTEVLLGAGCQGSADHDQAFDRRLDDARNLIVWRRSMPHGSGSQRRWPDLDNELLTPLVRRGFQVAVFATIRSHYCMVRSQLAVPHVSSLREAEGNIPEAMLRIASFASRNALPLRYVTYEEIIHCNEAFVRGLAEWDLRPMRLPFLIDGNPKYLSSRKV